MRFTFVDRILELQPGVSITTCKCLSMAEEYLADHFPRFPVMPGVLMLEAMTEAGAWLVRATEDFAHSIIVLGEAKNVRFADFIQPGRMLTVNAQIVKLDGRQVQVKTQGLVAGRTAVSGRLILERSNLADTRVEMAATDEYLKRSFREQFTILYRPQADLDGSDPQGMIAAAGTAGAGKA